MGQGSGHKQLQPSFLFKEQNWCTLLQTRFYRKLVNKISGLKIEEYTHTFLSQEECNAAIYSLELRLRLQEEDHVQLIGWSKASSEYICGQACYLKVFTQSIPKRLNELRFSIKEATSLFADAVRGFQSLTGHYGFFQLHRKMVGLSQQQLVKVWLDQQFSRNRASRTKVTESEFLEKLVKIVQTRTIEGRLEDLFYQVRPLSFSYFRKTLNQPHPQLSYQVELSTQRLNTSDLANSSLIVRYPNLSGFN